MRNAIAFCLLITGLFAFNINEVHENLIDDLKKSRCKKYPSVCEFNESLISYYRANKKGDKNKIEQKKENMCQIWNKLPRALKNEVVKQDGNFAFYDGVDGLDEFCDY